MCIFRVVSKTVSLLIKRSKDDVLAYIFLGYIFLRVLIYVKTKTMPFSYVDVLVIILYFAFVSIGKIIDRKKPIRTVKAKVVKVEYFSTFGDWRAGEASIVFLFPNNEKHRLNAESTPEAFTLKKGDEVTIKYRASELLSVDNTAPIITEIAKIVDIPFHFFSDKVNIFFLLKDNKKLELDVKYFAYETCKNFNKFNKGDVVTLKHQNGFVLSMDKVKSNSQKNIQSSTKPLTSKQKK